MSFHLSALRSQWNSFTHKYIGTVVVVVNIIVTYKHTKTFLMLLFFMFCIMFCVLRVSFLIRAQQQQQQQQKRTEWIQMAHTLCIRIWIGNNISEFMCGKKQTETGQINIRYAHTQSRSNMAWENRVFPLIPDRCLCYALCTFALLLLLRSLFLFNFKNVRLAS